MSTSTAGIERMAVKIPVKEITLSADIAIPSHASGMVIFAHGSGSGRHSPRNRYVANELNQGSIGTALLDLLTENEEEIDRQTAELRFDINLLADRVVGISEWIDQHPRLHQLNLGYFGASTGAAAALMAAARLPQTVRAVVSRGGRPDLARNVLAHTTAATLFIVGSLDLEVLKLNLLALRQLPQQTIQKLEIVQGASHLFEEAGTLQQVAILARDWFQTYLKPVNEREFI